MLYEREERDRREIPTTATPIVIKQYILLLWWRIAYQEWQQKKTLNHKNTKRAYTDRSKSIGKKVGFATVFLDITRRSTLSEEAYITTIKIVLKKIHKREEKNE